MKELIIGLDTSNYRTSIAAVTPGGEIILNVRRLLPVASGERGLRQSDALFLHLKQAKEMMTALQEACKGFIIAAAAASVKPRGLPESYMPVFLAGEIIARSIAAPLSIPFYSSDHQSGHIRAACWGTELEHTEKYLALHLSGGTTDLLLWHDNTAEGLGSSLDLHAGQLVDRVGVAMGLPFPAGPELEKLALQGESTGRLGCSMTEHDLCCHFSGAETKVLQWIREDRYPKEVIAREVFDLLSRTAARMLQAGGKKTCVSDALICGGVASSPLFRQMLKKRCERMTVRPVFGDETLSGDNAVGVALIGADRYRREYGR